MTSTTEATLRAAPTAPIGFDLAVHLLAEGLMPPAGFAWLFHHDHAGAL
jgi:hypothetical protein